MEVVSFIDIEETENDLMISFAIDIGDGYIETLLLHRQLIGEFALPEDERGTKVSHTGSDIPDEFLNRLESVEVDGSIISIKARFSSYQIDLQKISREEINQIYESLKRHNFDSQFKVQFT
ncbi:hypothetical protein [Vibrio genomosp. F6]|uniref:Uncharacterized protein n=2 Tax=Vibrio genomosp. F6 TaxID=723172 RepID=A0A1E5CWY8_9VIBR|nr:hypothetical protein [Vibrio genomosp. F6]OEE74928.1 hypothetical protein A130_17535 [Vibrio genomosp. F6 str. FF-238]RBW66661.1 hypothetical protein DS893_03125 [Vibrionales bacterium C3R12]TKF14207.1 hypothetical protein FCV43_19705 [Vibrio genomosp. F6]